MNKYFSEIPIPIEEVFTRPQTRYNEEVKMTPQDRKAGLKIYCKEPYAQALYDQLFSSRVSNTSSLKSLSKDFALDEIVKVRAKTIDFDNKIIETIENTTGVSIFVPFREFSVEPIKLTQDPSLMDFKVMVYKKQEGTFLGSEKKCAAIVHREDMDVFVKENKWFYVRVSELVKGGYLALYKNSVRCFLPGSHAAANVIHDFQDYINKEIPVMIESYDEANKLFIVSYKKYIKQTLPQRIYDLSFTKEYTGRLTDKPHSIGMFVEFENFFTGLVHSSEFNDYPKAMTQYKAGDEISVYIKDIVFKKGEPRVVLTLDKASVNEDRIYWEDLKEHLTGKTLDYTYKSGNQLQIELPDGEYFNFEFNPGRVRDSLRNEGKIRVYAVDVLRQNIKYELS